MTNEVLQRAEKFNNKNRNNRHLKKVLAILGCFVVFLTLGLMTLPAQTEGETNLKDYLNEGDYFDFTILDENGNALPEVDEDTFIVDDPSAKYELYMSVFAKDGFLPGTYTYKLPAGLNVVTGEDSFVLNNGVNIGSWSVAANGLITFVFNDNADTYSDVTITAEMSASFGDKNTEIDFDGIIKVIINRPPEESHETELNKWGERDAGDPSKLNWTVIIEGYEDSNIVGNTIRDELDSNHRFTEADKTAGLKFTATYQNKSHEWIVTPGDSNLTWSDNEWTYEVPETVWCTQCRQDIPLGNDGWKYQVQYSSTMKATDGTGTLPYTNEVFVDGNSKWSGVNVKHGDSEAGIAKSGSFQGDANSGKFLWNLYVTIPGRAEGSKATVSWFVLDAMTVKNNEGGEGLTYNNFDKAKITALYDGRTYDVPLFTEGTEDDPFAVELSYDQIQDGVRHVKAAHFYSRCTCTEDTCAKWNPEYGGSCGYTVWDNSKDKGTPFCRCWIADKETVFTFEYETDGIPVIEEYGGNGNMLNNSAVLFHKDVADKEYGQGGAEAEVEIPGIFKKELTSADDGLIANYTITVNEAKLQLTNNGSPLIIHDEMSDTLAYIGGSLTITAEDKSGNTTTLKQNEDFTVTYDGTGNKTNASNESVHLLEITIRKPKDVKYILNYDALIDIPTGATRVNYSNSAYIKLWGKNLTSDSEEKIYANINVAAKNYRVDIAKTDLSTKKPLPGAKFGFYSEHGGLIDSQITDKDGFITFQTNLTRGVIPREHTPYYLQEIEAPTGYILSDEKYWIIFCSKTEDCSTCEKIMAGYDNMTRIPEKEIKTAETTIEIGNSSGGYILPDTGGSGTMPYYLAGLALVIAAGSLLVINDITRRRKERGDF